VASVLDTAEMVDSGDQTAFNLAVWQNVLADSFLAGVPHRIETDRYGQIIMSSPPAPLGTLLERDSSLLEDPPGAGS
jgi:hypothetical protein